MSETIDPIAPIVSRFRRMELSDITEMTWLTARLQGCFPVASPAMIRSFLTQAHMAPGQWLGRTDHAAALAFVETGVLGAAPMIRVVFALGQDGAEHSEEVADLYREIARWAVRMEAQGMELAQHSDADRYDIRDRIGKLAKADRYIWTRPE